MAFWALRNEVNTTDYSRVMSGAEVNKVSVVSVHGSIFGSGGNSRGFGGGGSGGGDLGG